ncbi:MAG: tRNA pseudouridine(13) synthase TruD [Phycisphaerales bacterium]
MSDSAADQPRPPGPALPLTSSPHHAITTSRFDPRLSPPLYLTARVPPLGGWIKERPEDFLVDEQPAYQPCGEGEHLYLFVEKRGLATLSAARTLARHFGVPPRDIGYAGLKDKQAITRQVFSVHIPGKRLEDFPSLIHERLSILWADYHGNKLRPGHLKGNRFSIRIRGVSFRAALEAKRALEMLERQGVPNRFGEQRFGYRLNNHVVGRAILLDDAPAALDALLAPAPDVPDKQQGARELYARGDYAGALAAFSSEASTERRILGALARGAPPRRAIRAIDPGERDFYLTAFQSAVFNAVLDGRLREGALGQLREGDLALKHDNGAVFEVGPADPGPELDARLARFEISPSGPLWGAQMKRAAARTGEAELAALREAGLTPEQIEQAPVRLTGARRPLRVPLTFPEVEGGVDEHGPYVRVAFDLPRGAFATTVIRELIKPEPGGRGHSLTRAAEPESTEED